MPVDLHYYEVLQVDPSAPISAIKQSYYRQAMLHHPDKLPTGTSPSERAHHDDLFKEINEAYHVLSDTERRARYDQLGKGGVSASDLDQLDPREMFKQMFGGDAFVEYIGETAVADMLVDAMKSMATGEGEEAQQIADARTSTTEQQRRQLEQERQVEKEKRHEMTVRMKQRIGFLAAKLLDRLALYVEGGYTAGEYKEYAAVQAGILAQQPFGPELLTHIGYIYASRAKHYIGKKNSFLGLTGHLQSLKETGHMVSSTFNVLRSVSRLRVQAQGQLQPQLQGGSLDGGIDPQAVLDMLFKLVGLEIEGVLKQVCEAVLSNCPEKVAMKRAEGLKMLGQAFKLSTAPPGT